MIVGNWQVIAGWVETWNLLELLCLVFHTWHTKINFVVARFSPFGTHITSHLSKIYWHFDYNIH